MEDYPEILTNGVWRLLCALNGFADAINRNKDTLLIWTRLHSVVVAFKLRLRNYDEEDNRFDIPIGGWPIIPRRVRLIVQNVDYDYLNNLRECKFHS